MERYVNRIQKKAKTNHIIQEYYTEQSCSSEIKIFPENKKLREFINTRPGMQEMLEEFYLKQKNAKQ